MKKLLLLFMSVLALATAHAQRGPRGMNYQAVARNLSGEVLADQTITLRINLTSQATGPAVVQYSEMHTVRTNQLGLFSLVIGEGQSEVGKFATVPWSSDDVWMEVAIRDGSSTRFVPVSSSKLLAVPYAMHALTAGEVVGAGRVSGKETTLRGTKAEGLPASSQAELFGSGPSPDSPFQYNPATATIRVPLSTQSNSATTGAFVVDGGVGIGKNLNVGGNLSVAGTVNFNSNTNFTGKLAIADGTQSTSTTTGAITVVGGVGIGKNLNVGGNGDVDGTFNVDGATTLKNTLSVQQAVSLASTLSVVGISTFTGAMTVNAGITSQTLNVSSSNDSHVATLVNSKDGDGDGLKIKLGKTHPGWDGSQYLQIQHPQVEGLNAAINTLKGWIEGTSGFEPSQLVNLWPNAIIVGTACNLVKYITGELNSSLKLPLSIGAYNTPETTLLPGFTLFPGVSIAGEEIVPKLDIPSVILPSLEIVPQFTLIPAIPQPTCDNMPTLSMPDFRETAVPNSLTNSNEFITFVDKEDRKLGSVRAQSVVDWNNKFNGLYFVQLMGKLGGIDLVKGILMANAEVATLADSYSKIGVEYSSSHGDYAEWLERFDSDELITAGDIVGVRGGKITKDLAGAEQVMAVSYRPIVLGNSPAPEKDHLGNKVAFMGQIPVKVMGPVRTGDYIVAKSTLPGYGVAVHPNDMTPDDFRLAVGRSWEQNEAQGFKLANTVVGVHNGDYLRILKKNQEKVDELDARLDALESKINRLSVPTRRPLAKR